MYILIANISYIFQVSPYALPRIYYVMMLLPFFISEVATLLYLFGYLLMYFHVETHFGE